MQLTNVQLANIQGDAPGSATLSRNPRTLREVWEECVHGIGGRKPARAFTSAERNNRAGGIKQKYYRRRVIWTTIDNMVRAEHTADAAIHAIRQAYGFQSSVTQIINRLSYDRRHNRVPDGLQQFIHCLLMFLSYMC